MKFNETALKNLKPRKERYQEVEDGGTGLAIRVSPSGIKTFSMLYRHGGKPRRLSLGVFKQASLADIGKDLKTPDGLPYLTVAAAREALGKAQGLLQAGIDPGSSAVEQHKEAVQARATTTRAVADRFYAQIGAVDSPAGPQEAPEPNGRRRRDRRTKKLATAKDVKRQLDKFLLAELGDRPIGSIKRRELIALFEDIAEENGPIAANRALAWTKRFFKWAVSKDHLDANPAADVEKPGDEQAGERVLQGAEIKEIWAAAESLGYPYEHYVKTLLLTGRRRKAVAVMRWSEIDRDKRIWKPSGGRTNKLVPELPLPSSLEKLLDSIPRKGGQKADFVFRTGAADIAINSFSDIKLAIDEAIAKARKDAGINEPMAPWKLQQDIRRTVKTGLAELRVRKEIRDLIMGHARQGMDKIYDHSERREEKRAGLERWASHIDGLLRPRPSNVTNFPKASA